MKLTDEQMRQMEMDARRFSGAYTGTSGTLAAHVLNLLSHVRSLQKGASPEGFLSEGAENVLSVPDSGPVS